MCVCVPIFVTTFPEWLSGTEPLPHTPGAVRLSSLCCSVLRAHAQFCRFDKADATADVQWHCNHQPPLQYHYFPAQSSLGADILVYWIGKIVRTCAPGGSRTLDFLRARQAPYPLGQALRCWDKIPNSAFYSPHRPLSLFSDESLFSLPFPWPGKTCFQMVFFDCGNQTFCKQRYQSSRSERVLRMIHRIILISQQIHML